MNDALNKGTFYHLTAIEEQIFTDPSTNQSYPFSMSDEYSFGYFLTEEKAIESMNDLKWISITKDDEFKVLKDPENYIPHFIAEGDGFEGHWKAYLCNTSRENYKILYMITQISAQ